MLGVHEWIIGSVPNAGALLHGGLDGEHGSLQRGRDGRMIFRPTGFFGFGGTFSSPTQVMGWWKTNEYIARGSDQIQVFIDDETRARWLNNDVNAFRLQATNGTTLRVRCQTGSTPWTEQFASTQRIVADDGDGQLRLQADNVGLGQNATARPPLSIGMTNSSGGTLLAGDVVILDTSADDSVTTTTTADSKDAFVVVSGGSNGSLVWVATLGKVGSAAADATAISRGDTLVTSTTAGQLTVNNSQTDPGRIIGYALTTKGASAGPVDILMRR